MKISKDQAGADEDVPIAFNRFLRLQKVEQRNAAAFLKWIKDNLEEICKIFFPVLVSKRTAHNWIEKLNFSYQELKTCSSSIDGHERPDVVSYRKAFVQEMDIKVAIWKFLIHLFLSQGNKYGSRYSR